jgi:hypothetical protein
MLPSPEGVKYKAAEKQPTEEAPNVRLFGERAVPNSIKSPGMVSEHFIPAHRQN